MWHDVSPTWFTAYDWLFPGKAVRFRSLGWCECVGRMELGMRAEPEQNAKAGKLCGLFPLYGGPLHPCSGQPLLLRSSQVQGFSMQPTASMALPISPAASSWPTALGIWHGRDVACAPHNW